MGTKTSNFVVPEVQESLDKNLRHRRRRREAVASTPQTDRINTSIPAEFYRRNLQPQGQYDTFIHSWSPDFKADLSALYQPKASLFEREQKYEPAIKKVMTKILANVAVEGNDFERRNVKSNIGGCFGQIGMALSISKALDLVFDFENKTKHRYSAIMLARPDVILLDPLDIPRNLPLGRKAQNTKDVLIWNTHGNGGNADFHYRMSRANAQIFKNIFSDFGRRTRCSAHSGWVHAFLAAYGLQTREETTCCLAGEGEEVYYKAQAKPELWAKVVATLEERMGP